MIATLLAGALAAAGAAPAPSTPTGTTPASTALQPGVNESFESVEGLPPGWQVVEYAAGISTVSIESGDDAADGKQFLRIASRDINHTRVVLPTTLEPGATYRFSARIRATGGKDLPAVLALDGADGTISDPVPGDGKWHARRLYLHVNSVSELKLVLSLGWFSNTVAGQADFDLLKLKKVDATPPDVGVAQGPGTAPGAAPDAAKPKPATVTSGPRKAVIPVAVALFVLLAFCGRVLLRGDRVD